MVIELKQNIKAQRFIFIKGRNVCTGTVIFLIFIIDNLRDLVHLYNLKNLKITHG